MEPRRSEARRPSCAFAVRTGDIERRSSRAALIDEVRSGKVSGDAMVSCMEFFGDGSWRRLDETSLWRICQAGAGTGSALVPAVTTSRLDLVPTSISAKVCADAEVNEPYMLALCQAHGITLKQLHHLVGMRVCFETNMATMHRLLDDGLSLDEVEELYDARESLRSAGSLSLEKLVIFYRTFFDGTCVPGSYMASEIMDARSTLHHDCYLDTTVDVLCSAAGRLHAADLEFVVGQLAQTRGGPA